MKSKKKLLLMGVGVMGALAMGVGATSTFAWYTATAAGVLRGETARDTTVSTRTSVTLEDIPFPVTVSVVISDDAPFELMTWVAEDATASLCEATELADTSLYDYYDEAEKTNGASVTDGSAVGAGVYKARKGHFIEKYYLTGDTTGSEATRVKDLGASPSAEHWAHLTVTVTIEDVADIGGVAYSKEQILSALKLGGKKFNVVAYAKDNLDVATKARFYGAGVTTSVAPTSEGADELQLNTGGTSWADNTFTYTSHGSLYIDGAGSTHNQNVKGDVKVVVSSQS